MVLLVYKSIALKNNGFSAQADTKVETLVWIAVIRETNLRVVIDVLEETEQVIVLVSGEEELRLIPLNQSRNVVGVVGFLHVANGGFLVGETQWTGRTNVLVELASVKVDQLKVETEIAQWNTGGDNYR